MIALLLSLLATQDVSLEEKMLARHAGDPAGPDAAGIRFRPDGRAVAYVRSSKLFVNGTAMEEDADVRWLAYGAAGDFAYLVRRGNQETVVFNGEAGKAFSGVMLNEIVGPFVTARREVVYRATEGESRHLIVGRNSYEVGRRLEVNGFAISASGRVAYVVPGPKETTLYVDGKKIDAVKGEDSPARDIMRLTFSPDCRRLAYVVKDGAAEYVAVDGKRGPRFDKAAAPAVTNNARPAYAATREGKTYMVLDGRLGDAWTDAGQPVFSSGGTTLAYWARKEADCFFFVGYQKHGPYQSAGGFTYSPDGKTWAFRAVLNGPSEAVVCEGKIGDAFPSISEPLALANGGRVAYRVSQDNQQFVVIAGARGPAFDQVSLPLWSADGAKCAYFGRRGSEWFVRSGDAESGPYRHVQQLAFSADGAKLAFGAWIGDELWWKVIDAK